jgi:DNA-binding Lrp family transcriptional regulator
VTEQLDGQLDERLVAALCRDGRADLRPIAESVDAVPTRVQKRLRALEEGGVVEGYTARVDYEALGYRTAVLRLRVELSAVERVTERLREADAFVTVYETSGPFTVFAVGKFASEEAVAARLRELHADPDVEAVDCDLVSTVTEGTTPLPGT